MGTEAGNTIVPEQSAGHSGIAVVGNIAVVRRVDWCDRLCFAITTALVFAIYLFTLAPNVPLDWSGIFSTGAMYGGVPFSGGYPAWTIYALAFAKFVPFGNVAWRVNLSSAVAAAVACGLIAMIVSYVGKLTHEGFDVFSRSGAREQKLIRWTCGYVAGVAFGLSGAVWGKALIGEFWALGALLFAGGLWLFTRWFFEPVNRWRLYGTFLLTGLLLTNNQELLLVLPALVVGVALADERLGRDCGLVFLPLAAVLTAWCQWWLWIEFPSSPNWPVLVAFAGAIVVGAAIACKTRCVGSELKAAALSLLALCIGLTLNFYVPLASMTTPPVNWGYPRTADGFLNTIGRSQFERPEPTRDFVMFAQQLWWFVKLLSKDFGVIYLPFAAVPIMFFRSVTRFGWRWLVALVTLFVCVGVAMVAMLNPQSTTSDIKLLRPYFICSYAVMACMCGVGLIQAARFVVRRKPSAGQTAD